VELPQKKEGSAMVELSIKVKIGVLQAVFGETKAVSMMELMNFRKEDRVGFDLLVEECMRKGVVSVSEA